MFVYVPLFPYISDGPFWPQKGLEQGQCNKTWWYNMLYINNFFNEVSFNVDILSIEKNAQFFLFYSYFICLHILSWHHDLQTVMYKLARFNTRLFALYCILHWLYNHCDLYEWIHNCIFIIIHKCTWNGSQFAWKHFRLNIYFLFRSAWHGPGIWPMICSFSYLVHLSSFRCTSKRKYLSCISAC